MRTSSRFLTRFLRERRPSRFIHYREFFRDDLDFSSPQSFHGLRDLLHSISCDNLLAVKGHGEIQRVVCESLDHFDGQLKTFVLVL